METQISGDPIESIALAIGAGEIVLSESGGTHVEGVVESEDPPDIEQHGSSLRLWTDPRDDVRVRLAIPAACTLHIRTRSADVTSSARLESATIGSGSGNVNLTEAGRLRVTTGSGDIGIDVVTTALQAGSGSGSIHLSKAHDAALRSGSGDITAGKVTGNTNIRLGSGDATVTSNSGRLRINTASGDIRVGVPEGEPTWLDLRTRSGEVTVNLDPASQPDGDPTAAIQAQTASGDIWITRA